MVAGTKRPLYAQAITLGILLACGTAHAKCRSELPGPAPYPEAGRDVDIDRLARLRDVGSDSPGTFYGKNAFGVSPDGKHIAFQIRQADPDTNSHCLAIAVLDLRTGGLPRIVDRGGQMIRVRFTRVSLADYYAGNAKLITPAWSPDGRTLAFLKQTGSTVQVWTARADGGGSRQWTRSATDVQDFAWAANGRSIVIKTIPDYDRQRRAIAQEGLTGWLYDDRWSPIAGNHPWPVDTKEMTFQVVDGTGKVRTAGPAERQLVESGAPPGASYFAASPAASAWIAPVKEARLNRDSQLYTRSHGGPTAACEAETCRGIFAGLWWSPSGDLWLLRQEGWANSVTALYVMRRGDTVPSRTLSTRALLLGCTPAAARLVCALEQSSRPRRIVSIDPRDGATTELFDPNPEFGSLRKGSVERLEWENDRGIKVYGDLVLPPGWNPSAGRLPLVIVQYVTRGFLRGGTGDEFPIFPFAARGFAVLSLQRPAYVADLSGANTHAERVKLNYEGWADRKSVMSAYATGIQILVDRGIVDPKRVGITGLSDGTVSAAYALLNSKLFAAASLTACCEDPKTQLLMMGNLGAEDLRNFRYPAYTDDAPAFWDPYSIARNAARFSTPLLSQTADDEYLGSVEAYASLREYGKPMELIVFPDEHHVKWQPAHRISVYRRNLAWFEFWLQGDGAADALPSEVARWREMRSKLADPQDQVPRR